MSSDPAGSAAATVQDALSAFAAGDGRLEVNMQPKVVLRCDACDHTVLSHRLSGCRGMYYGPGCSCKRNRDEAVANAYEDKKGAAAHARARREANR